MRKFLKQTLSLVISLMMLFTMTSTFAASNDDDKKLDFGIEQSYGELFLKSVGHPSGLSDPMPLLNLEDELEAVCFTVKNGGYIIVNVKDLSIPELSLEKATPFKDSAKTYVYNGPLAYMSKSDGKLTDLSTGDIVKEAKDLKYKYKQTAVDKLQKSASLAQKLESKDGVVTPQGSVLAEKYLSTALKTWVVPSGTNYCGPTSMAILMQFYDDVVSDNFVAADKENSGLIDVMVSAIRASGGNPDDGAISTECVNGLNNYLSGRSITGYGASRTTYNWSTVTGKIDANRPLMVGLVNHPTYGNHWVTGHGYVMTTSDYYVVVNDGWGSNGVWITYGSNMDYMVYLAK